MSKLEQKITILNEQYSKDLERLYFDQLTLNSAIEIRRSSQSILANSKLCQYCKVRVCTFYCCIQSMQGSIELCLACTYRLVSNKHANCILDRKITTHHGLEKDMFEDSYSEFQNLESESMPFLQPKQETSDLMEQILNIPNLQLQMNPEIKLEFDSHEKSPFQRKIPSKHLENDQKPPDTQIMLRLFNIDNTGENFEPLRVTATIIVVGEGQKIYKSVVNETKLVVYFYKEMLERTLCKTYNKQDLIPKKQIQFLYEYWLKEVTRDLTSNGIKINQFLKRGRQLTKKVLTSDKRITELNRNTRMDNDYIGFKKVPKKWNSLIEQLRRKDYQLEKLKNLDFSRTRQK